MLRAQSNSEALEIRDCSPGGWAGGDTAGGTELEEMDQGGKLNRGF